MKKKMSILIAVGTVLTNVVCLAAPLVGEAVGTAVERAVVREVAESAAKQTVKTGAEKTMSFALAGVSAKQFMGAGVGIGAAVAIPVAVHEIADGYQDVNAARAATIRETGTAAAQTVREHPEMAQAVLATVNRSNSVMGRIERMISAALPWGVGLTGVFLLMFLLGFGLKSFDCFRRGLAEVRAQGAWRESRKTCGRDCLNRVDEEEAVLVRRV